MIQVNLLPDIKQKFIKAKRSQRIFVVSSILIAGSALAIFLILFVSVKFVQKAQIDSLSKSIAKSSSDLKAIPDIDRILTVQAQLKSLPDLHAQKPVAQRLSGYVTQITPTQATISKLSIDFEANTITMDGSANTLETVNKFVDTVKFTNYKVNPDSSEAKAFSNVVLTSFGRDSRGATYEIQFSFDPQIFSSTNDKITLIVPSIVTTRSETELPLFKQAEPTTTQGSH